MHYDEQRNVALVHAGIPPQWSLRKALKCAAEVEEALRDDQPHRPVPRRHVRQRSGEMGQRPQGRGPPASHHQLFHPHALLHQRGQTRPQEPRKASAQRYRAIQAVVHVQGAQDQGPEDHLWPLGSPRRPLRRTGDLRARHRLCLGRSDDPDERRHLASACSANAANTAMSYPPPPQPLPNSHQPATRARLLYQLRHRSPP